MDTAGALDEVSLLKRSSTDSESLRSSEIDRCNQFIQQRQYLSRSRRLSTLRICLDLSILLCLGVVIYFLVQIQSGRTVGGPSSCDTCKTPSHRAPVGSDLSGVVPLGTVGGRTKYESWGGRRSLYVKPNDFHDKAMLNGTLRGWERIIKPFVKADPSWDGHGPERPLIYELFEVSAFHQIHCLSGLLEDFSYMAMGIPQKELPSVTRLEKLDWAEHNAHCFNYVFEALLCFADSTVEGATPGNPPVVHKEATHVCNDWDALLEWAEKPEHRMPEIDGLRAVN